MLKTDFSKVSDIFLTYPKNFEEENNSLTNFFEELIGLIPDEIHQFIIVNNKEAANEIIRIYPTKKIGTIIIEEFNEIWLRDILGFNTTGDKIIKPIYKPDYYKNIYEREYLELIEEQTKEIIHKTIRKDIIKMPLVMDGGNLVTNGEVGIITDKIFRDNPKKSKEEITETLKEFLGIRPIIIETSKYDKLGHSDGYLSFLNEREICLASYPEMKSLKKDIETLNSLERKLKEEGLEIVKIYDRPHFQKTKSKYNSQEEFLYNARGVYVNFLTLNENIILPQFTLSSPRENKFHNDTNKETLLKSGKKVKTINTDVIGDIGGGCHCLSYTN